MSSWLTLMLIGVVVAGFVFLRWSKKSGSMSKVRIRLPKLTPESAESLQKQKDVEEERNKKMEALLIAKEELMRVRKANKELGRKIAELNEDNVDHEDIPAPVVKKRQMGT